MANTTKKIVETHVGKDVANIISGYTKYNYCYVCGKKKAYFPYMNYNKDLKIHYCNSCCLSCLGTNWTHMYPCSYYNAGRWLMNPYEYY